MQIEISENNDFFNDLTSEMHLPHLSSNLLDASNRGGGGCSGCDSSDCDPCMGSVGQSCDSGNCSDCGGCGR